jgi:phosphatidylglycerophosphate synthase
VANSDATISQRRIQDSFSLFSWSLAALVRPVAVLVIKWSLNHPTITPNRITASVLILRLAVAFFFLRGSEISLIAGATIFYSVAVLDAVDGPVARLTGTSSEFGRYFDHISDLVGDIIILVSLVVGQGIPFSFMVFGLIFMHIAESYISYLTNIALSRSGDAEFINRRNAIRSMEIISRYRRFFFKRNLKSFLSYPDYAILTFVVFPLIGMPVISFQVSFHLLLLTTLYTVFSTFISLHTGERRFP